jgi:hypothetical protein
MGALIGLGCAFLMVAAVVEILLKGWVLTFLWEWFAVPLGLPPLGVAHAIGLAALVGLLTHQVSNCQSEDKDISDAVGRWIGSGLIGPFLVLLIGYIVHSFM